MQRAIILGIWGLIRSFVGLGCTLGCAFLGWKLLSASAEKSERHPRTAVGNLAPGLHREVCMSEFPQL